MSALAMMMHMLMERLTPGDRPRVPEPDLVMDAPEQVAAFAHSGDRDGPLAPIYLYLATQAASAIPKGGRVLDLACGPCNQLAVLAALHPDTDFVGLDLSATMLEQARTTLERAKLRNVTLVQGDMRTLSGFADQSFDGVFSTLSLHHLPTPADLAQTGHSVARVLRPGAGVYLADFGRLKRQATLRFLVQDRENEQTPLFTQDFMNSLQAAFSLSELRQVIQPLTTLGAQVQVHTTALAPFMVIMRRAVSTPSSDGAWAQATKAAFAALSDSHQRDVLALANWFQAGGLPLPLSLQRSGADQPRGNPSTNASN